MRIGIVGPTWPDSFTTNIIDALPAMGHEPVALGSSFSIGSPYTSAVAVAIRNLLPALDERMQRHIARTALDAECEIVINLEQRLMPGVVHQLRRNGVKVAMWFPDALLNMGRQLMLLAPYDAVFVKEPHLVARLGAVLDLRFSTCQRPAIPGGTGHWLPLAPNPTWSSRGTCIQAVSCCLNGCSLVASR